MDRLSLLVSGCILCGVVLGTALAQSRDDQNAAVKARQLAVSSAQEADDGGGGTVDDRSEVGAAAVARQAPARATTRRYLVTYVKSRTDAPRSATVVTVVNRSSEDCEVTVRWYQGFRPEAPACTTTAVIGPRIGHDFCSRDLLENITTCNSICDPEASFFEGRAVLFSSPGETCGQLGIDARMYYTTGETTDTGVAAVSNPKILSSSGGNLGD